MKHLASILILQLISHVAFAGNVAKVFAEGVFGVPWESPKALVVKALPGGKAETQFGIASYTVQDGRSLFGVQRKDSNSIRFTFDSNDKLSGVSIEFPLSTTDDYGSLLTKLNTTFGKPEAVPNSFGVNLVKWPEDKGLTIGLSQIPGTFSMGTLEFTIEHRSEPAGVSKHELGF